MVLSTFCEQTVNHNILADPIVDISEHPLHTSKPESVSDCRPNMANHKARTHRGPNIFEVGGKKYDWQPFCTYCQTLGHNELTCLRHLKLHAAKNEDVGPKKPAAAPKFSNNQQIIFHKENNSPETEAIFVRRLVAQMEAKLGLDIADTAETTDQPDQPVQSVQPVQSIHSAQSVQSAQSAYSEKSDETDLIDLQSVSDGASARDHSGAVFGYDFSDTDHDAEGSDSNESQPNDGSASYEEAKGVSSEAAADMQVSRDDDFSGNKASQMLDEIDGNEATGPDPSEHVEMSEHNDGEVSDHHMSHIYDDFNGREPTEMVLPEAAMNLPSSDHNQFEGDDASDLHNHFGDHAANEPIAAAAALHPPDSHDDLLPPALLHNDPTPVYNDQPPASLPEIHEFEDKTSQRTAQFFDKCDTALDSNKFAPNASLHSQNESLPASVEDHSDLVNDNDGLVVPHDPDRSVVRESEPNYDWISNWADEADFADVAMEPLAVKYNEDIGISSPAPDAIVVDAAPQDDDAPHALRPVDDRLDYNDNLTIQPEVESAADNEVNASPDAATERPSFTESAHHASSPLRGSTNTDPGVNLTDRELTNDDVSRGNTGSAPRSLNIASASQIGEDVAKFTDGRPKEDLAIVAGRPAGSTGPVSTSNDESEGISNPSLDCLGVPVTPPLEAAARRLNSAEHVTEGSLEVGLRTGTFTVTRTPTSSDHGSFETALSEFDYNAEGFVLAETHAASQPAQSNQWAQTRGPLSFSAAPNPRVQMPPIQPPVPMGRWTLHPHVEAPERVEEAEREAEVEAEPQPRLTRLQAMQSAAVLRRLLEL